MTHAAARGDAQAISQIERSHFGGVGAALARLNLSSADRDEVLQLLRHRLFTANEGNIPKIAHYSGSGDLGRWLRVVAVRLALDRIRTSRPSVSLEDALTELPGAEVDLELAYFKVQYRTDFRGAVALTITTLGADERRYLRLHIVDRASLEHIAQMEGLHRATAARRIARAKEVFLAALRDRLFLKWGVGSLEARSIIRLIQSDFQANLASTLRKCDVD